MRILVTGATGYIGRHLIPQLSAYPETDICIMSRDIVAAETLFVQYGCRYILADDFDGVRDFNPEVVLHMATLSTSRCDDAIIEPMLETNINYGVKLLAALHDCKAMKLFVNIGSFAEYRTATDELKDAYLYTATKSAFRHFVDFYADYSGYRYVTLVLYTIYGGNDLHKKIIDYVFDALNAAEPVKMSGGEQILDFTHVDDVVAAMCSVIVDNDTVIRHFPNSTLYIGTGVGTSIRGMASMVEELTGRKLNAAWGALPYRALDVMKAIAPVAKNPKKWTWRSKVSLQSGLERKLAEQ